MRILSYILMGIGAFILLVVAILKIDEMNFQPDVVLDCSKVPDHITVTIREIKTGSMIIYAEGWIERNTAKKVELEVDGKPMYVMTVIRADKVN